MTIRFLAPMGILSLVAAWAATVPTLLTPFGFFTIAGLFATLLLVAKVTYDNGQSPQTVAQLLHVTDTAEPRHPSGPRS